MSTPLTLEQANNPTSINEIKLEQKYANVYTVEQWSKFFASYTFDENFPIFKKYILLMHMEFTDAGYYEALYYLQAHGRRPILNHLTENSYKDNIQQSLERMYKNKAN